MGCSQPEKVKSDTAVDNTEISRQAVDSAFKRMWQNVTFTNLASYMKTDVADNFFAIDADGVTANIDETLADTTRLKMLESLKFKFFDEQIKSMTMLLLLMDELRHFQMINMLQKYCTRQFS